jgi:hypothetical protein
MAGDSHAVNRSATGFETDRGAPVLFSGAFSADETLLAPVWVVAGKVSGKLELRAG